MVRTAFIGGGNMAEALIVGLTREAGAGDAITVAEPLAARREHLHQTYGVVVEPPGPTAVEGATMVVLAVKPGVLEPVLTELSPSLAPSTLLVSVVAGVSIDRISRAAPDGAPIIRAMPNTPAMVQRGATAVAAGPHATEDDVVRAEALFRTVGRCVRVPESRMDAVTGLSGSGPAFAMLFLEAMADGAVRCGLPRPVAMELAAQTLLGAAALHLETGDHPGVLKDRVTSPGGTTIAGVAALEAGGFRAAVIDAVSAAAARSRALGRGEE
ncbi:MAG: pyrroline-5-carboxylate reductase [Myxococcota bacterium]